MTIAELVEEGGLGGVRAVLIDFLTLVGFGGTLPRKILISETISGGL